MSTFFKVQTGRNRGIMSFLKGDPSDRSPKRIIPVKTIGFYIVLLVGKVIIKAKMVRALLGILKTTQDVTPDKWKYVPIQDFTEFSDIDWKKSVHEIDLQLYRKYKLSKEEIDFIENNVKEMV